MESRYQATCGELISSRSRKGKSKTDYKQRFKRRKNEDLAYRNGCAVDCSVLDWNKISIDRSDVIGEGGTVEVFSDILVLTINEFTEKYGLATTVIIFLLAGCVGIAMAKVTRRTFKRVKSRNEFERLFGDAE